MISVAAEQRFGRIALYYIIIVVIINLLFVQFGLKRLPFTMHALHNTRRKQSEKRTNWFSAPLGIRIGGLFARRRPLPLDVSPHSTGVPPPIDQHNIVRIMPLHVIVCDLRRLQQSVVKLSSTLVGSSRTKQLKNDHNTV